MDLRDPGPRRVLYAAFPPPGSTLSIHTLQGDAHAPSTVAAIKRLLGGRPLDVLFLDGDHTEAGVWRELELYRPLLRSGGLVVFHDVNPLQARPANQVHHVYARLPGRKETVIAAPHQPGYGLGFWWG